MMSIEHRLVGVCEKAGFACGLTEFLDIERFGDFLDLRVSLQLLLQLPDPFALFGPWIHGSLGYGQAWFSRIVEIRGQWQRHQLKRPIFQFVPE